MPTVAIVSFRLGGTDGVSVIVESWKRALKDLGCVVTTVAGSGSADQIIPGLAWPIAKDNPPHGDTASRLVDSLDDIDLVIVENICSLPLNAEASEIVARSLKGRPAVMHHHDLPWQRKRFAHIKSLPSQDDAWRHITINELSRRQLSQRGIQAQTIFNGFDFDQPLGSREETRAALGIEPKERVVLHPVRAIERKGIPSALLLSEELGATYWLTGPAEEGYGPTLDELIAGARCRVIHMGLSANMADAYAAADVVAFPSTWEGFGNPLIESAIHRRPLAAGNYPVASEVRSLGFKWFSQNDAPTIDRFLNSAPSAEVDSFHEHNCELAKKHFSYSRLRRDLGDLLSSMGFTTT